MTCNCFLPFHRLPFHFVNCYLCCAELFNWVCSHLFIFAFVAFTLMSNLSLFDILRVRTRIEGLFPFFLHPKNIDNAVLENLPANAGDKGSIPGSRRSPGRGNGNPLQYSCLGIPMDRGAWRAVHGVAESHTALSTHTHKIYWLLFHPFFSPVIKIGGKKIEKRTEERGKCP